MAYTAPSAVNTGDPITKGLYNTFVKDNIIDHEARIVTAGPAGVVSAFAGTAAPTGWLLCDGSQVSQTTYAALYAVVGANAFGADSGGNFFLPNLKGRTVIGVGVGTEITGVRGTVQGVKEVTLTGAQSGTSAHSHPTGTTNGSDWNAYFNHYSAAGGSSAVPVSTSEGAGRTYAGAGGSHQHTYTVPTATAAAAVSAHTNIQPSLPLNYIIKF
jgi:microcystin-dependent protein